VSYRGDHANDEARPKAIRPHGGLLIGPIVDRSFAGAATRRRLTRRASRLGTQRIAGAVEIERKLGDSRPAPSSGLHLSASK